MAYFTGQRLLASQVNDPTPTGDLTLGDDIFLTSGGRIEWNGDTNLLRSGIAVLRTDGDLEVAGGISLPRGIRMRGRRTTTTGTFTSTETGILRLDDCAITAGRSYRIKVSTLTLRSTVAQDPILASVRYTTNGSTPSTASPVLPGAQAYYRAITASAGTTTSIETTYEPAGNETLSLLLSAIRPSGTGNIDVYADASAVLEMIIEDVGKAAGNTGTVI